MKLNTMKRPNKKPSKRLGRGAGSGRGKTAGRGTKGQKARSGFNIPRRFEGGQSPLIQRLPKKTGFTSFNTKPAIINLELIEKEFKDGETVSLKSLISKGLVDDKAKKCKILGNGKISKKIKIEDCLMSKKVQTAIEKVNKS